MIQKWRVPTILCSVVLMSLSSCRSRGRALGQVLEHCPKAIAILGTPVQIGRFGAKLMDGAGVWMPPGPGCEEKIPVKGPLASGWVYESLSSDECLWLDLGRIDLNSCHE